jgi:phospholipid-binding lipoprotein MlaA
LAIVAAAGMLGGCATSGNPKDPLEGVNRAVFAFNEGLDKAVIKPVAQGYEAAVPLPARTWVSNFFANVSDLFVAVNNLLQGKPGEAGSDIGRLAVNSTIGILGFFDVASELGLEKHEEDFGQTLGRWGVGDGPYVVLPFFGPRTLRDTAGLVVDGYADPVYYAIEDVPTRNILYATRIISTRAQLLPADKVIEEAALDKYTYIRDAYLQRRRNLIHDGNPPRVKDDDAMAAPSERMAGLLLDPVVAASELVLVTSDELLAADAVEGFGVNAGDDAREAPVSAAPAVTIAQAVHGQDSSAIAD